MTEVTRLSFGALALLGVAACGHADANPPPQTPSTTTTTAATPAVADTPQAAPPDQPMSAPPPPSMSGADAPSNTATPLAGSTSTGVTTTGTPRTDANPNLSDAQMAQVEDAANTGETAQAREAITRAKNPRVKQFAHHMIADHEAAENKLRSIESKDGITPQDNPTSDQIKQGGDGVMSRLRSSNGADFDKAYIDAQVDQHQKVLDVLDRQISQTQNADLQTHLKDVRSKVAQHLKMARDIQSSLAHP